MDWHEICTDNQRYQTMNLNDFSDENWFKLSTKENKILMLKFIAFHSLLLDICLRCGSSTVGWSTTLSQPEITRFCTDIHSSQWIIPGDCGDLLTFTLAPPVGSHLWYLSEMCLQLLDELKCDLVQTWRGLCEPWPSSNQN